MGQVKKSLSRYKTNIKLKETLPKASAILLMLVLLAVLFNVAAMMSQTFSDRSAPKAIKGVLNLANVNLEDSNSVPLSGNWTLYWKQLYTPEDLKSNLFEAGYLDVPHAWVRETLDGEPMPKTGFATYQLVVETGNEYETLVMRLPTFGTAFKLYVDDALMAQAGQVSELPELAVPDYDAQSILFSPQGTTFTITLQISNHHFQWGWYMDSTSLVNARGALSGRG